MFRLIQECRPRWVIAENVPGLITISNGMVFESVCLDLESEGYVIQAFIIPACAVNAPHRRDRVWIVANNSTIRDFNRRSIREIQGEEQITHTARIHKDVAHTKRSCRRGKFPERLPNSEGRSPTEESESLQSEVGQAYRSNPEQGGQDMAESSLSGFKNRDARKNIHGTYCKFNRKGCRYNSETWSVEPDVGRVAHGVPNRVDRLKSLGNAIVPQVAYQIFKAIKEVDLLPPPQVETDDNQRVRPSQV